MKTCLVHTCYEPQIGEKYDKKKCRCRKLISQDSNPNDATEPSAAKMLQYGFAMPHLPERVETGRTREEVCAFCMGDKIFMRSCQNCAQVEDETGKMRGSGKVITPMYKIEYSGNIVLTQEASVNALGEFEIKTSRQQKTTRVDGLTRVDIENSLWGAEHVKQLAIDKIRVWGEMAQDVIRQLTVPQPFDEKDDPWRGRALLYSPVADERTSVGTNR
jgi:hypothetical protein